MLCVCITAKLLFLVFLAIPFRDHPSVSFRVVLCNHCNACLISSLHFASCKSAVFIFEVFRLLNLSGSPNRVVVKGL